MPYEEAKVGVKHVQTRKHQEVIASCPPEAEARRGMEQFLPYRFPNEPTMLTP